MAIRAKYTKQQVIQVDELTDAVLRRMAEDDEVSLAEVGRRALARGLRSMAGYSEALAAVQAAAPTPAAGVVENERVTA